ncbi:MAG: OB-fold domain-containing protein [Patescibacteria group bacterium]|nr:OB-fold domain-containing protein [Patescibacteria group bacterium]
MTSPIKIWREQKKIKNFLGLKGKVVSATLVRVPPLGFSNQAPYFVAIVDMENPAKGGQGKQRLIGQMVDVFETEIKTGQKVEVVYRKLAETDKEDVIHYGIKFRPTSP